MGNMGSPLDKGDENLPIFFDTKQEVYYRPQQKELESFKKDMQEKDSKIYKFFFQEMGGSIGSLLEIREIRVKDKIYHIRKSNIPAYDPQLHEKLGVASGENATVTAVNTHSEFLTSATNNNRSKYLQTDRHKRPEKQKNGLSDKFQQKKSTLNSNQTLLIHSEGKKVSSMTGNLATVSISKENASKTGVVNAANGGLRGEGTSGTNKSLYEKYKVMWNESRRVLKRKLGFKTLKHGEAARTVRPDGSHILHARGGEPKSMKAKFFENQEKSLDDVYSATYNALSLAAENGIETVYFPELSTGSYSLGEDWDKEANKAQMQAIESFVKGNPGTSIKDIKIVVFDKHQQLLEELIEQPVKKLNSEEKEKVKQAFKECKNNKVRAEFFKKYFEESDIRILLDPHINSLGLIPTAAIYDELDRGQRNTFIHEHSSLDVNSKKVMVLIESVEKGQFEFLKGFKGDQEVKHYLLEKIIKQESELSLEVLSPLVEGIDYSRFSDEAKGKIEKAFEDCKDPLLRQIVFNNFGGKKEFSDFVSTIQRTEIKEKLEHDPPPNLDDLLILENSPRIDYTSFSEEEKQKIERAFEDCKDVSVRLKFYNQLSAYDNKNVELKRFAFQLLRSEIIDEVKSKLKEEDVSLKGLLESDLQKALGLFASDGSTTKIDYSLFNDEEKQKIQNAYRDCDDLNVRNDFREKFSDDPELINFMFQIADEQKPPGNIDEQKTIKDIAVFINRNMEVYRAAESLLKKKLGSDYQPGSPISTQLEGKQVDLTGVEKQALAIVNKAGQMVEDCKTFRKETEAFRLQHTKEVSPETEDIGEIIEQSKEILGQLRKMRSFITILNKELTLPPEKKNELVNAFNSEVEKLGPFIQKLEDFQTLRGILEKDSNKQLLDDINKLTAEDFDPNTSSKEEISNKLKELKEHRETLVELRKKLGSPEGDEICRKTIRELVSKEQQLSNLMYSYDIVGLDESNLEKIASKTGITKETLRELGQSGDQKEIISALNESDLIPEIGLSDRELKRIIEFANNQNPKELQANRHYPRKRTGLPYSIILEAGDQPKVHILTKRKGAKGDEGLLGVGGAKHVYQAIIYDLESSKSEYAADVTIPDKSQFASVKKENELQEILSQNSDYVAPPFTTLVEYETTDKHGRTVKKMYVSQTLLGPSLDKVKNFDEFLPLFCDAAKGLADIHAEGIVHRDIKPDNLFTKTVQVEGNETKRVGMIGDFGNAIEAKDIESENEAPEGTKQYRAPDKKWSQASDIWAMGVSLWSARYGEENKKYPAFILDKVRQKKGLDESDRDKIEHLFDELGETLDPKEQAVRSLITDCLQYDPEKRIKADELVERLDLIINFPEEEWPNLESNDITNEILTTEIEHKDQMNNMVMLGEKFAEHSDPSIKEFGEKIVETFTPLKEASEKFISELEQEGNPYNSYESYAHVYRGYADTHESLVAMHDDLMKSNKNVYQAAIKSVGSPFNTSSSVTNRLILPVQRLPRHELLTSELSKQSENEEMKNMATFVESVNSIYLR